MDRGLSITFHLNCLHYPAPSSSHPHLDHLETLSWLCWGGGGAVVCGGGVRLGWTLPTGVLPASLQGGGY